MIKTPRHLRWLVGGIVGFSLLSACGTPDEQPGDSLEVSAPEATAGEVAVKLSMGTSSLAAKDNVQVTVTLTNVSSHAVRLLARNTPVDGIKEDLFNVTRDGASVAYLGRHYKWAAPQASDYLTLAAGESITRTVSLSDAYDFAQTGSYSVSYAEAIHQGAAQFSSNSLNVWVEGRPFAIPEASGERIVSAESVSTTGCTSSQTSSISSAFSGATTYASGALSYLTNTTPSGTARYTTWFGTYSSTNWSTAKSHYTAILNAYNTKSVVVRLRLHGQLLRLRVPVAAVQDLRVQRLLERAHHGHGLEGRHPGPRDEPLHRGGQHGRLGLRPDRVQEPGDLQPHQGVGQRGHPRVLRREQPRAELTKRGRT